MNRREEWLRRLESREREFNEREQRLDDAEAQATAYLANRIQRAAGFLERDPEGAPSQALPVSLEISSTGMSDIQQQLHSLAAREVASVRERLLRENEVEAVASLHVAEQARRDAEAYLASAVRRHEEMHLRARELDRLAADIEMRENRLEESVRETAAELAEAVVAPARREALEIVAGARAQADRLNDGRNPVDPVTPRRLSGS